ncbi:hypothetical protein APHNP_0504 [Anaplasma phagocytophilum str. ApNP]|uniref:Uncharacterized protein n=3 Tax=Anaplasma phagocytophilum TaxID=948 RepID=A0A161I658_ANAPH|nr:hypothetical protein [Anaplasma phagocytophilum]ANC34473.1 hypothetical protein P029_03895 [Anaplasma phagocytophilum str. Norway variant2]KJV64803.1 hypothetical protein APHMUC_0699 [Anaplasma phagocytophilum str. ApMUC09]KJV67479.1 hypothetical protein APHNP_0504 [Anaplasma phagocytophilum str. ApNP]
MNLSAKIISWRPTNAEILPIFAVYPLLNTNAASVPYSDASFASISAYFISKVFHTIASFQM